MKEKIAKPKFDEMELSQLHNSSYKFTKWLVFFLSATASVMMTLVMINLANANIVSLVFFVLLGFASVTFGLGLFITKYLSIFRFVFTHALCYLGGLVLVMPINIFTETLSIQVLGSVSNILILFSPFLLFSAGVVGYGAAFYYLRKSNHELSVTVGNSKFSDGFTELINIIFTFLSLLAVLIATLVSISLVLSSNSSETLNISTYDSQAWEISGFIIFMSVWGVSTLFQIKNRYKFNLILVFSFLIVSITFLLVVFIAAKQWPTVMWPIDSKTLSTVNPFLLTITMAVTGVIFSIKGSRLRFWN